MISPLKLEILSVCYRKFGRLTFFALLLVLKGFAGEPTSANTDEPIADELEKLPFAKVEKKLPAWRPPYYYQYAARLWTEGKRDEAVFWFYEGQLRYRIQLAATPDNDPSGEPALFGALQEQVGRPINTYARGDLKKLIKQIDAVLAWDETHENATTPKGKYGAVILSEREKFKKYRDHIRDHMAEMKEQYEEAGIGEYGVKNGVYHEEQNPRMDKHWPELLSSPKTEQLAGTYQEDFEAGLTTIFFANESGKRLQIDHVRLEVEPGKSLVAVGLKGDVEVVRRTLVVTPVGGGWSFSETQRTDSEQDGRRKETETCILRKNKAGELVVERRVVEEGQRPNQAIPYCMKFTFWSRAKPVVKAK